MELFQRRDDQLQSDNSRSSFFKFIAAAPAGVAVLFLTIGLVVGLSGCATKPPEVVKKTAQATGPEFGQWRGQGSASRIVQKENGSKLENWSVNLEVVSKTPGFGRIEVTGAMGVYGGTIAWNKNETRILLPGQRKFVIAPNSNRAFMAILPFEISPGEVEAILFDRDFDLRALKARGITCKKSETREVCSSSEGFSLDRTRGLADGTFEVKAADGARVKMQLVPVRAKAEERDELWALEAPRGFKVIQQ